ncbi:MAG: hypothetical protein DHS20C02_19910 [Micavibrio sp.]|nr:MAG: hypothetical protein DHS20C02_19910 [Micavibrio sp.]
MNEAAISFQTPVILMGFCYLSGMAMFLAALFWQWRVYRGDMDIGTLRVTVGFWLLRILTAITLASLAYMMFTKPDSPMVLVPEISLLFFISALYMMARADKNLVGVLKDLPFELLKTVGVTFACLIGWAVSLALGWSVFEVVGKLPGNVDGIAVVVIGLLWNAPLLLLYLGIQAKSKTGEVFLPEGLKFYKLLWPVLAAYILLVLPEFIELVANAPKIRDMMQAGPPLQRV